jgi:membrane protein DedA with SNARE-associated domain
MKRRWWIIILNVFVVLSIFYLMIGRSLQSHEPPDLLSFSFTIFAGYLFFLLMPVELIFIYFANAGQINLFLQVALTVSIAMTSQSIDYLIGHSASQSFIKKLISPKRFVRANTFLIRYGHFIIFIFNVLPLSSPILCLSAEMLGFPYRKVLIFSTTGLLIKYSIIALFFL